MNLFTQAFVKGRHFEDDCLLNTKGLRSLKNTGLCYARIYFSHI